MNRLEIGSFIELQFEDKEEYYDGVNTVRLNTGRAAIYHAVKCMNATIVYLPYYQCDTVRDFLLAKKIEVRYYHINSQFEPIKDDIEMGDRIAIVIVNYYGIMGTKRMKCLAEKYTNVIIDNCQAFFAKPISNCLNVYSTRKFVGVPDGAYVIGPRAMSISTDYEQDYSSDTSLFLLQRIEYGCEGKAYLSRKENEERIDNSDIKQMSKLTKRILKATNYEFIQEKRKENFYYLDYCLKDINLLKPKEYIDENTVPMVYPFASKNKNLVNILLEQKHFQGQWWAYILNEMKENCMETWLSEYMVPLTIDQRYNQQQLNQIVNIVKENI